MDPHKVYNDSHTHLPRRINHIRVQVEAAYTSEERKHQDEFLLVGHSRISDKTLHRQISLTCFVAFVLFGSGTSFQIPTHLIPQ